MIVSVHAPRHHTQDDRRPLAREVPLHGVGHDSRHQSTFHAALDAGDRDAALALLTPDVIVLEEGGAERSREEYAGHHLPADIAFAGATRSEVARRAAAVEGDVAWIMTEGRTTGRFDDRAVDRLTAETMVLTRGADGWRIRHIHWSSRAPN
ncbi:MAG: ketosteroid isomerase-like protein [Brevundimonas sp.]|jgi:ketosteroid isomerase-like protein|uniref:YybH family protein n=1 Tax=Brevundimonas sp. TaxID=1871086 RepID=UPI0039E47EBB